MGLIIDNTNIIILENKIDYYIITLDNKVPSIVPRTGLTNNYYVLFPNSLKLSHFHDFISVVLFQGYSFPSCIRQNH